MKFSKKLKLITLLYPFSEYFRKAQMCKDRLSFVPYKNLRRDVEGTVLELLRQFQYILDTESTVEAPSLSLVSASLELVDCSRNYDAHIDDKAGGRVKDISDRQRAKPIAVASLQGEAAIDLIHSVPVTSENVLSEGPLIEDLAVFLRREKLRAGSGNLKSRIGITKLALTELRFID